MNSCVIAGHNIRGDYWFEDLNEENLTALSGLTVTIVDKKILLVYKTFH